MAFTEKTKLEAKRKADYTCVICKDPFVHVHHIVPQSDGGSDELENAAPLCPSCHDRYGGNPDKRKDIRGMRDLWWDVCETRTKPHVLIALNTRLDDIQTEIRATRDTQASQARILTEIKATLTDYHLRSANCLSSAQTPSQIVEASGVQLPLDQFGMATDPQTGETGIPVRHDGRIVYI